MRWNTHLNLAAGWYPKQLTRPADLLKQLVPGRCPPRTARWSTRWPARLIGAALPAAHTAAALTAFFGKQPTSPLKATDAAVAGSFAATSSRWSSTRPPSR